MNKLESKHNDTIELSLAKKNYNGSQNVWFQSREVSYKNLEATFKENNYSPIKWVGGSRKEANFLYSVGFVADIDDGLEIQTAYSRLQGLELNFVLIPSKSHSPEKHKFHIFIPFNIPVRSVNTYKKITQHIGTEIFPECDTATLDAARYIYGSPDNVSISNWYGGKDFEVESFGPLWDNTLKLKLSEDEKVDVQDLKEKTVIHCPFHNDETPSAFVDYSEKSDNWYIVCSSCEQTFWMQKTVSLYEKLCEPYWSYGTDVFEFGILGEEFFFEKIGEKKFHVKTKTDEDKEDKKRAYQYLVGRKHIRHITRIDYLGDIESDSSYFDVKLDHGVIEVHYAAIPENIADNNFIEVYLADRFGKYKDFIKHYWAMYCYTNHIKLPTLVFKGIRGNGKSTFAEITGEIFRPLTFEWHGHEDSFTYEVEKKLLIVEENETSGPYQYKTLKKYTGQKYSLVKKKFKDPYTVRNNMNIILLANDALPLFVSREELPTSEYNNQFFVYEFPAITGDLDVDIQAKLEERLGHYIRTELKTVFDNIDGNGCRYGFKVPITNEETMLFKDSVSNLEADSDKYIQKLVIYNSCDNNGTYSEFTEKGYLPTQFFRDFDISNTHVNSIVKNMKRRGYLIGDAERIQVEGNRQFCYQMTKKLINEIENTEFEDKSGGRATKVAGEK